MALMMDKPVFTASNEERSVTYSCTPCDSFPACLEKVGVNDTGLNFTPFSFN